MANKTTVALTKEQYENIINTMRAGSDHFKPNDRIATALVMEANLGMRIEDILNLRLNDIIRDGERYRLNAKETKTGKKRTFTVPMPIYNFLRVYALDNDIPPTAELFPITERAVQKHLKTVCEYLGYENLGTHSFRKFFATEIYKNNRHNVALVKELLQHSSIAVTQRYIGVSSDEIEEALAKHIELI